MRFDEAILWGDKFIQTTLKYKARSEQEFINSGGTPSYTGSYKTPKRVI